MFCSLLLLPKPSHIAIAAFLLVQTVAAPTLGQGASGAFASPDASALPAGPTKGLIVRLQREFRDGDAPAELLTGPLQQAKRALERSQGARAAGDIHHGALLQRLAQQWAAFASSLFRAIQVERQARKLAKRLQTLSIAIDRGRTLLGEQHARRGRLRAAITKAQRQGKERLADE